MPGAPYYPRGQEIDACDHDYEVKRTKPHPAADTETVVEVCQDCGAKHVYIRPTRQRPITEFTTGSDTDG